MENAKKPFIEQVSYSSAKICTGPIKPEGTSGESLVK